jgi:hypothetical protein
MYRLSIVFLLALLATVTAGNDHIVVQNDKTINTPIAMNSKNIIVSTSHTNQQQQPSSPQQQRRLFDFWSFLFACMYN